MEILFIILLGLTWGYSISYKTLAEKQNIVATNYDHDKWVTVREELQTVLLKVFEKDRNEILERTKEAQKDRYSIVSFDKRGTQKYAILAQDKFNFLETQYEHVVTGDDSIQKMKQAIEYPESVLIKTQKVSRPLYFRKTQNPMKKEPEITMYVGEAIFDSYEEAQEAAHEIRKRINTTLEG